MTQPKPFPLKTSLQGDENSQGRPSLELVWRKASVYRAIREKCLDCCAGQPSEVATCAVVACPLHPYRFGASSRRKAQAEEATP